AQAVRGYGGRILGYVVITMTSTDFERLFEGLYSATHVVILLDPTWQTIYTPSRPRRSPPQPL
uniref:hypothetical protein n=1 Tax=Enterocloster asparagiformis TaxID=333367 RepID=UPI00138AD591